MTTGNLLNFEILMEVATYCIVCHNYDTINCSNSRTVGLLLKLYTHSFIELESIEHVLTLSFVTVHFVECGRGGGARG